MKIIRSTFPASLILLGLCTACEHGKISDAPAPVQKEAGPSGEQVDAAAPMPPAMPAQMPPMGMGMGGMPAAAPSGDPATRISGIIQLSPSIAEQAAKGGVVFVMARPPGATGGMPLASVRLDATSFPLEFSLGAENAVMGGGSLGGEVSLEARLDADGNAATKAPGDLVTGTPVVAAPGATGVTLELSKSL